MSVRISGKLTTMLMLGTSAFIMSSCVGGTTYGTGVTQEKQLVEDLRGMLKLGQAKKTKTRIDYSARPDLVVPAYTATLPVPQEQVISTSNVDWPESPGQRLARVRNAAEKSNPLRDEINLNELMRKKEGIRVLTGKFENPDIDRDGHDAITNISENTRKNKERLRKLSNKHTSITGTKRKYLTEPPIEYRTPASTAPIGDLGVSEAEKERRAEKAANRKFSEDTGMWVDN